MEELYGLSALSCQPPSLCELYPFRQCAHSCVDNVSLLRESDAFIIEIFKRNRKCLYELVLFELRLWVLVLRPRHVYRDVNHSEVGIAETWI